jgi:rare lipoprotein A
MNQPGLQFFRLALIAAASLLLSACGIVKTSTAPDTRDFGPIDTSENAVIEAGIASWYGSKFHGRLTANGETYNMNDLTAAHKTLPFNTVVKVENLDNGNSVIVRINDRGPYIGDRIIDLSRRAARDIGMYEAGIANVRVFLVEEGDRPLTARNTSSRETFTVQLASYNSRHEAEAFSTRVSGTRIERVNVAGRAVYRVYYGSYDNTEDAGRAQRRLAAQGFDGFVKQEEN